MPKRSNKSPAGKSVSALLLLTCLGAGVLAAYVKLTPQASHVVNDLRQDGPDVSVHSQQNGITENPATSKSSGFLVPVVAQNDIKLDKPSGDPPPGVQPEVFLVNETLTSLQIEGARALGVEVKNGTAMVSFNPGIEKGYGSIEEGYLIKALSMALGQFPNIDKYQVVVEGRTVDSLGNIDLTTPVDVIRPNITPETAVHKDSKSIDPG